MTQILKIKPPVDPKNTDHYVNNQEFKLALTKYYNERQAALASGEEPPRIQNYLGECFLKIARGLGSKYNFRNYSYLDDMIQNAVYTCIKNVACYDVTRGTSPFAYFTQCVWYQFIGTIKHEKKKEQKSRNMFFQGDYDTYTSDEDGEHQLSYNNFILTMGTDDTPFEQDEERKRKKFEGKKTNLSVLFEE